MRFTVNKESGPLFKAGEQDEKGLPVVWAKAGEVVDTSWTLNTTTGKYDPPVAKVEKADDGVHPEHPIPQYWDEDSQTWKLDDYTPVGNIIEI